MSRIRKTSSPVSRATEKPSATGSFQADRRASAVQQAQQAQLMQAGPRASAQAVQLQRNFGKPLQRAENKTGLPDGVKSQMEGSLGADFSNVRVHANSNRATEVGALAYTQGTDVHFAPGQFSPDSTAGQELIGHELTHVVQQSEGRVRPTTEVNGMPVNDDPGLESEADTAGRQAAQAKLEV